MTDVSIIICTHNPGTFFRRTLAKLCDIQKNNLIIEILIVDNASFHPPNVNFEDQLHSLENIFDVRVISEKKQGLAFARTTGVRHANGEVIIFCDDDNHLQSDFVHRAYKIITSDNKIGALGGQSTVPFKTTLDVSKCKMFAVGQQASRSGVISQNYLWGAGLVMRRSVFMKFCNRFEPLCIGRTPSKIETGDDGEICIYVKSLGLDLYYSEDLRFIHDINPRRMTDSNVLLLEEEFRNQINFRILSFTYDLVHRKLRNPKYFFYCLVRPITFFTALFRIYSLKMHG